MPTIEDIPVELRQQIASHLDTKSFKAFRQANRQLSRGTFPDLLKRGSPTKRIRFTLADLERTIGLLEDKVFVAKIKTIAFDPCKHEILWSQHWMTLWTLMAKIRRTYTTSRPSKLEFATRTRDATISFAHA